MKKIRRTDWRTDVDCRLLAYRQREAVDEANRWASRKRRALRARRGFLRRLNLWGR